MGGSVSKAAAIAKTTIGETTGEGYGTISLGTHEDDTMATLHIHDDTYRQLASKAAADHTTVEALVQPVLDGIARNESVVGPAAEAGERRRVAFARWQGRVQARRGRRPDGHGADDSRGSIYGGPEERGT